MPQSSSARHDRVQDADLGLRRGGVERAVHAQFGIDVVFTAELRDMRYGRFGCLDQPDGLGLAEEPSQREELCRPGEQASAVAPARAGPAEIAFKNDNVQRRILQLGLDRRPQAGEATADDADVGSLAALQSGRQLAVVEQALARSRRVACLLLCRLRGATICDADLHVAHEMRERRHDGLRGLGGIVPAPHAHGIFGKRQDGERLRLHLVEDAALQHEAAPRVGRQGLEIARLARAQEALGIDVQAYGFQGLRPEERTQERQASILVQVIETLLRRRLAEVVQQMAKVVQQCGRDEGASSAILFGQVRGLQRMARAASRVRRRTARGPSASNSADDVGDREAHGYQGSE